MKNCSVCKIAPVTNKQHRGRCHQCYRNHVNNQRKNKYHNDTSYAENKKKSSIDFYHKKRKLNPSYKNKKSKHTSPKSRNKFPKGSIFLKLERALCARLATAIKKQLTTKCQKCLQTFHILDNFCRHCGQVIIKTNKTSTQLSSGQAITFLGCSVQEAYNYIESKFSYGMDWTNYGNKKDQWSIDHILPLSKFNLLDVEVLKQLCHYTNLQPLWVSDNVRKRNKI